MINKKKNFKLKLEYGVRLVPSIGTCLATDKITVDGMQVGYMYRDYPHDEKDSGWRFIAGVEDEDACPDGRTCHLQYIAVPIRCAADSNNKFYCP